MVNFIIILIALILNVQPWWGCLGMAIRIGSTGIWELSSSDCKNTYAQFHYYTPQKQTLKECEPSESTCLATSPEKQDTPSYHAVWSLQSHPAKEAHTDTQTACLTNKMLSCRVCSDCIVTWEGPTTNRGPRASKWPTKQFQKRALKRALNLVRRGDCVSKVQSPVPGSCLIQPDAL